MLIEKLVNFGKKIVQKGVEKVRKLKLPQGKIIIFYLGAGIYMIARVYYIIAVMINSPVLPGVDDAYSYVVTGVETQSCIFQECQAFEDLEDQILPPSADLPIAQEHLRQYHRLFSFYHPLYSFVFAGVNSLVSSPEAAYEGLMIFGAILVNLAICYWLYSAWGPGGAGITLGLLAFAHHSGSGLLDIDPSDYATGVVFISWGLILKNSNTKRWSVPLLVFLMCAIHDIGQIYAVITIALFLLLSEYPFNKRTIRTALISTAIVGIFFFLIPLIPNPDFSRFDPASFYTGEWSRQEMLRQNFELINQDFIWWGGSFSGLAGALLLILIGFISIPKEQRYRVLVLGGLLVGLYAASFFYIVPWFPGIITMRVWIPLRILLYGAIGFTIWQAGKATLKVIQDLFQEDKTQDNRFEALVSSLGRGIVILLLLIAFFFQKAYIENEWLNGEIYATHKERSISLSSTYWLDPTQPDMLLSSINAEEYILYMDEMPLYYYLSHGVINNHTIFYPAIKGTPDEKLWLDENLRYLVTMNPIGALSDESKGAVPLTGCSQIVIESEEGFELSSLEILVANKSSQDKVIALAYSSEGVNQKRIKINISAGKTVWYAVSEEEVWVNSVAIQCGGEKQGLTLEGMSLQEDKALNWPWDQGINLWLMKPDKQTKISFDTVWLDEELDLSLKVIADDGVIVLAEVLP